MVAFQGLFKFYLVHETFSSTGTDLGLGALRLDYLLLKDCSHVQRLGALRLDYLSLKHCSHMQ